MRKLLENGGGEELTGYEWLLTGDWNSIFGVSGTFDNQMTTYNKLDMLRNAVLVLKTEIDEMDVETAVAELEKKLTEYIDNSIADSETKSKEYTDKAVNEISEKFSTELTAFKDETEKALQDFENSVNETIANTTIEQNEKISALYQSFDNLSKEVTENYEKLVKEFAEYKAWLESWIVDYINEHIGVLAQLYLWNPTKFERYEKAQTVVDDIYHANNFGAITANEYDELGLTANEYNGMNISVYDYDNFARQIWHRDIYGRMYSPYSGKLDYLDKILLLAVEATRNGITANEFDGLELTADAYNALELSASKYDSNAGYWLLGKGVENFRTFMDVIEALKKNLDPLIDASRKMGELTKISANDTDIIINANATAETTFTLPEYSIIDSFITSNSCSASVTARNETTVNVILRNFSGESITENPKCVIRTFSKINE